MGVWAILVDNEPGPINVNSRPCKRPLDILHYTNYSHWLQVSLGALLDPDFIRARLTFAWRSSGSVHAVGGAVPKLIRSWPQYRPW
jgi:hypothetical protein